MSSKVYLIRTAASTINPLKEKLKLLIKKSGVFKGIQKNDLVALKISFGEKDNKGYINPAYVSLIVDEIKRVKAKPFLTDTNTLYKGERMNAVDHLSLAAKHGFTYEAVGAPIIISDGLRSQEFCEVKIDKIHYKTVKIASSAIYSDYLVGLTHFTGHMLTCFGGAIKNIGMGLANRAGKLMQHSSVAPSVSSKKCTACLMCIRVCPVDAIIIRQKVAFIQKDVCIGCGDCVVACKFDAIEISWDETTKNTQEKMAEYAFGALLDKKACFITFAIRITKECDCLSKDDPRITEDIGILASCDPVAIDKAAADLVIKKSGKDVFKETHPKTDWCFQIEHGERIGLGSSKYKLIEIK